MITKRAPPIGIFCAVCFTKRTRRIILGAFFFFIFFFIFKIYIINMQEHEEILRKQIFDRRIPYEKTYENIVSRSMCTLACRSDRNDHDWHRNASVTGAGKHRFTRNAG